MNYAPIALFVYARPEHTHLTVQALQKNTLATQSDLFIFSDAAKSDSQKKAVEQVRDYVHKITGFKSITIIEQKKNKGLANSIIDGVSAICEQHGKVIVLEDDLETSPYFLDYMNKALLRYENDTKVMQISGHMFDVDINCTEDAFFLPFATSWGWATWANRWSLFDENCSGYHQLKNDKRAIKLFNLNNSYPYFKMLEAQIAGKIDSWAIRWNLTVFLRKGLVLFPSSSLVSNHGFDGSGVHCRYNKSNAATINIIEINDFPNNIKVTEHYKNKIFDYLRVNNGRNSKVYSMKINFVQMIKLMINKLRV
jgi:hypothetical protein